MKVVETHAPEETFALGEKLGKEAESGAVFTLDGDLGVGKTVFAQGFAAGMGVQGPVNSPTFTIVQEYEGRDLPFYHFDAYRIGDESEMEEIGFEEYVYGDGVSLIEWASQISGILPEKRTAVTLEKDPEKGFDYRKITIEEIG